MKIIFTIASLFFLHTASVAAQPVTDSVIVNNFVFDSSGSPWLGDWVIETAGISDTASFFLPSAPPGSSAKWSLLLIPYEDAVSRAFTHLSSGIYQLSCWAKSIEGGEGSAWFIQDDSTIVTIVLGTFTDSTHRSLDTNWIQYFLTDTVSLTSSDTFQIILAGEPSPLGPGVTKALINNISFVKLLPSGGVNTSITGDEFQLGQNYPNPFPKQTTFPFSLDKPSVVTLKIFNILGTPVCTVFSGSLDAGAQHISFDRRKLLDGDYIYELTAQDESGIHRGCKIMSME